jgi:hypothetical protein
MLGDFTQLGPIKDKGGNEVSVDATPKRFVVDSECWQRMAISRIFLNRSFRQQEGDPFLDLLNQVRVGKLTEESKKLLLSRIDADITVSNVVAVPSSSTTTSGSSVTATSSPEAKDTLPDYPESDEDDDNNVEKLSHKEKLSHIDEKDTTKATETAPKKIYSLEPLDIFPYKYMVDRCNKSHLDKLVEKDNVELKNFYPALRVGKREYATTMDPDELQKAQYMIKKENMKQLQEMFPLFYLTLAEGAQVMMRSNKFIDQGIYNGSMGIITSIDDNIISVLFMVNGKFLEKPVQVERIDMSLKVGKTVDIIMTQYPLTLAWGSTIHKCQGLTLDRVRVGAANCFEPGQFYVAISRVRKVEHLSLLNFHEQSIMSDPRAVAFETIETPIKEECIEKEES